MFQQGLKMGVPEREQKRGGQGADGGRPGQTLQQSDLAEVIAVVKYSEPLAAGGCILAENFNFAARDQEKPVSYFTFSDDIPRGGV